MRQRNVVQKKYNKMSFIHLKEKYKKEVIPAMMKEFGYKNSMAVPGIEKVTINTSFGRLAVDKKGQEKEKMVGDILKDMGSISGQCAVSTKTKKSIASFKTREGVSIGACVTLRKQKMYDFLERLIHISIPRTRDFRGIKASSVDERGNLTIGIKEHICFSEISPEKLKSIFGLEITITTTAKTKKEGLRLLELSGFPIKR